MSQPALVSLPLIAIPLAAPIVAPSPPAAPIVPIPPAAVIVAPAAPIVAAPKFANMLQQVEGFIGQVKAGHPDPTDLLTLLGQVCSLMETLKAQLTGPNRKALALQLLGQAIQNSPLLSAVEKLALTAALNQFGPAIIDALVNAAQGGLDNFVNDVKAVNWKKLFSCACCAKKTA
jgi:hypothetical protein